MLIMKEQIAMIECFVLGWANKIFDCTIVRLVSIVERLVNNPRLKSEAW